MALEPGDIAPDISLSDHNGDNITLAGLRGKTVVLFFYPKADTPGCTTEACSFRDTKPSFDSADVVILGISPDKPSAQLKFANKFELPYRLLADIEHQVAESYGVWVEKSMYGRKYMGVARTTFIIGPDGILTHVLRDVKVAGHGEQVLKALGHGA